MDCRHPAQTNRLKQECLRDAAIQRDDLAVTEVVAAVPAASPQRRRRFCGHLPHRTITMRVTIRQRRCVTSHGSFAPLQTAIGGISAAGRTPCSRPGRVLNSSGEHSCLCYSALLSAGKVDRLGNVIALIGIGENHAFGARIGKYSLQMRGKAVVGRIV